METNMQGQSKKVKQHEEFLVDRISSLPDHLLHSMMFMLCESDAAKMSLLSKEWYRVWTSFPIIDIDEANYPNRQDFIEGLRSYLHKHHLDHLQKLSLRTLKPMIEEEVYENIDKFVYGAIGRGNLHRLELNFNANRMCGNIYLVPDIVFSNGSSLTYLRVAGCDLKPYKVLNVHLLRTLKLRHVLIDNDLIQRLMISCPLLEKLSLEYYHEPKSIRIVHDRIRKLSLSVADELEELEIRLPNLQSFKYKGYYSLKEGYMTVSKFETPATVVRADHDDNQQLLYKLNCFCLKYAYLEDETFQGLQLKYVRKLMLHYIDVENEVLWFTSLQFPSLAYLSLKGVKGLEEVNVISSILKGFWLEDCVDIEQCKLMAPNLLLFKYQGAVTEKFQLYASARLRVNLVFKQQPEDHGHDLLQRLRLRSFLRAFYGANELTIKMEDECPECTKMLYTILYPSKFASTSGV